ncbi:hypothetical protein B6A14_00690 [Polynucleobacter hirudinilacicola]|uniref:TRAP ABC transporter substrate-binding protein n=1 Tax=Polynucleobacter hirudinilacicola TaxID=1743166 RepID=A0A210RZZ3_9BURK|nr:TAXI family TRAP transporter solute-binding subunit [Polynucleobacter hirudinilacicola]OWF66534.1 hypothetical protein B6A14_00690 [Polynucleobacter hirudinilacicola]
MTKKPHHDYPNVEGYFLQSAKDEVHALSMFFRYQWYVALAVVLGIFLLLHFMKPLPPSEIRISRGQPNSSLEVEALNFQKFLEKEGVKVELVPSKGTLDSLELLRQKKVDVALTQSGLPISGSEGLVSLGSVGYQSFWYFYTGPEFHGTDIFQLLKDKRIYVNQPGSGTRFMVDSLLKISGHLDKPQFTMVENLSPKAAVDALKAKQVDGLFLIAGYDSLNIKALLADSNINILSFPIADALNLQLKGVDIVTLPMGAFSLSPLVPKKNTKMVAVATTIIAEKTLHPDIQYLLLEASREMNQLNEVVFDYPGGFPAFTEKGIPRSDVAEKFYEKGPPSLKHQLPHWLASFLDIAWFTLVAMFAIIYPLVQLIPGYRKTIFEMHASHLYTELFDLNRECDNAKSLAEINACIKKVDEINEVILKAWVPKGAKDSYGNLLNVLNILNNLTKEKKALLERS